MRKLAGICALAVLYGCTTFHGLKALEPSQASPGNPPLVADPRPMLRWEPASEAGTTYDLVIFEAVIADDRPIPGRIVYRRERLAAPEHRVEEPLAVEQDYFWTVRARRGVGVGEWARYDYQFGAQWKNSFYRFYVIAEKPKRPF
jgi:hypothetical protein